MKQVLSLMSVFFVLSAYVFSAPIIKVLNVDEESHFNWGKVAPSQKVLTATFPITNIGTDTLIISEVKPACGCTTAPLDKNIIPPGDTARMTINFNTRGYKGYTSKAISIFSNDSTQSDLYVFIHADIVYPIAYSPKEYLVFLNTVINEPQVQNITLTNTTDKDITISEILISSGEIKINVNKGEVIKAKDKLVLTVTYAAIDGNTFHGSVNFKTDCAEDPVLRIFVQGIPKK